MRSRSIVGPWQVVAGLMWSLSGSFTAADVPPAPKNLPAVPALDTPPRVLEKLGGSSLPALDKTLLKNAPPAAASRAPAPSIQSKASDNAPAALKPQSKEDTSRSLPRTLPAALTKKTGDKPSAPPIDPMIRKVSAESTSPPTSRADAGTGATRGSMVRPQVELRQVTPPQVTAGMPAQIELVVTNEGETFVDKVILTDSLDSTLEVVSSNPRSEQTGSTLVWSIGRLEPKESRRVTFSVVARRGTQNPSALSRASISYSSAVESEIRVLAPEINVSVDAPERAMVGQPLDMRINLTNKGNSPASNVILRCVLPPGLSHSEGPELEYEVGELPAGETRNIPLTLSSSTAGSSAVRVVIQADGLASTNVEQVFVIEDFKIRMEAEGPAQRYLNQTALFKFRVINDGAATATGGVVLIPLPEGLSFAHASDAGQVGADGHTVRWDVAELSPGQSKELTLTCVSAKIGSNTLKPEVLIGQRRVAETEHSLAIRGVAALSVEVTDVADPIEIGGETIYEIHVVNQGTMPATQIVVQCEIPTQLEALAADGPTGQRIVNQTLTFDPLAELAPRAEAIFRVKCKGMHESNARFTAIVRTAEIENPTTEEESTTIYDAN